MNSGGSRLRFIDTERTQQHCFGEFYVASVRFFIFNIVKNVSVENSRYNSRKSHQTGGFCGNYSGCFLVEQKGSSSFTKESLYLCTVPLTNNPFVGKNKHLKATCDAESPAGTTQQPARLITGPNVQMPSLQNAL